MNLSSLSPYYCGSLVLVGGAGVLLAVAVLADLRNLTGASLVISAMLCLFTAVLLGILSVSRPLNPRYVSHLPVQNCINLCRIFADLGIQGVGYFFPPRHNAGRRTVEFIPVANLECRTDPGESFDFKPGSAGSVIEPSGAPLFDVIKNRQGLTIPSSAFGLSSLIREISVDVLEISDRTMTKITGETVIVTLENYRFIDGCRSLHAESPKCCLTVPCPVCSIFASILAEGQGKVVSLELCAPNLQERTVTAVFSVIP